MKLVKILLLVVMAASILGCVSSPEARKKSVDPQAAFDQHIKLAMQYIGSKSRDLARVHLQKAERFESKANRSQSYNGYALLYQMEQEMELAEKHYRKAISSNKKDSMVRYNFAAFLYNQGRFQQALDQMQLVTEDLDYERRT
jgi:type IV pilus assembly protein PilF